MKLVPSFILLSAVLFTVPHQRQGANADTTCPKNCKPFVQETIHCDQNTKECAEGCNTGFYGITCEKICQCGGGACGIFNGDCMEASTMKPALVSPGNVSNNEDCKIAVPTLAVSVLILVIIVTFIIARSKEKILEMCKGRRPSQQREGGGDENRETLLSGDNVTINHVRVRYNSESAASQTVGVPTQVHRSTSASSVLNEMPEFFRNLLIDTLGVHFLNAEDEQPFILFCVQMQFDDRRVNTEKARVTMEGWLVNEAGEGSTEKVPESFMVFSGTTCLSPIFHGDSPTYLEVIANVQLHKALPPNTKLLCIGFCREKYRDEFYQVPWHSGCYNLFLGWSDKHGLICTKIYREKKICLDEKTDITNKEGASGCLKYGILIYKGKKAIIFFDAVRMKRLHCLENVNFEQPLWPMFGVFRQLLPPPRVSMKLVTGRDIEMSSEKKNMIIDALSSVKN